MRSLASIFIAPALCVLLLGGIVAESFTHTKPKDAEPFHAAAKHAIEAWPRKIGDEWISREWEMPPEAVKLLKPNVKLGRHYENLNHKAWQADLMIVQCKSPNDMSGHYPPNCYPQSGWPLVDKAKRTWDVAGLTIKGYEYHFEQGSLGQPRRMCVYNFFIVPGKGVVPDETDVREATGDYMRRDYGAAQFQVVFPPGMDRDTRDQIFVTLIGANPQAFQTLNPPGI